MGIYVAMTLIVIYVSNTLLIEIMFRRLHPEDVLPTDSEHVHK